jgi:hypothetical protein
MLTRDAIGRKESSGMNLESMRRGAAIAILAAALAAPVFGDQVMEQKRQAEIGLKGGEVLSKDNWQLAEGLLPPEILAFYKSGDWQNTVADWPVGLMKHEKEFDEATKENAGTLDVDELGGIIDKRTGKQPPHILGFPFPNIDPKDPKAGVKVYWNFNYMYYNVGNSKNFVDLNWVGRGGLERSSGQEVYFYYYDGQKPKYQPKQNPMNLLQQFIATSVSPQDLYGTTALGWRFRDAGKRDSAWAYVPALRRIRGLSPANRSDGFLGSDMSQDDGPFFDGKPEDFTWKLAGEAEVLRLADPLSLKGESNEKPLPGGGWRTMYPTFPFAGFEDPNWKGAPWAPIPQVLTKRKAWIIEATPKDKYYLYGKVQLYIDQETYQGMWNRKYSWKGESLNTSTALGYLNGKRVAPDGSEEWFWASNMGYQAAFNLKMDRATVTGWALKGRDKFETVTNDRRIQYDPAFFDYQTLYRFGK